MAQFEQGFALLIGVDENNVPEWSLPPVAKDITALEQVLTHPERCAYPPEHVKTIRGKTATRQGILDGLDWLQESLQKDKSGNATAIIHYSGHGWRDETAQTPVYYLIPYDVRRDNFRFRAIRSIEFADAIQALTPRRLLVILDCCHAGGMDVRDIQPAPNFLGSAVPPGLLMGGERDLRPVASIQELPVLAQGHGRAILSSSQGEQPSYNRRDGKMGIFTYHLIEALTGHAQPEEGASEVLVSDMMSHVSRRVPKSAEAEWGKIQQPEFQVSGNFPVAMLLGGKGLGKGQRAPDPLALPEAPPLVQSSTINTGGGAYIGGGVRVNGGDFVGRDKIIHGDEVRGDKVGWDKIQVGNITGSTGVAIGSNAHANVTTGLSGADLDKLFVPIFLALRDAPPEKREKAVQKAEELKAETAKGKDAEDSRMARLLDELVSLVPGAVTAVVSAFASPILAGIAGPVTKFVLEKINAKS